MYHDTTIASQPDAHQPVLPPVLWHGTNASKVEGILERGLLAEKSLIRHTCLTSRPEIAFYYARLQQSIFERHELRPILIRIETASLDAAQFISESGSATIAAYGKRLPGRRKQDLEPLLGDWRALFAACDAIGTKEAIPVAADMVEWRCADIPALSIDELYNESVLGVCPQAEARAILRQIASETGSVTAIPLAA